MAEPWADLFPLYPEKKKRRRSTRPRDSQRSKLYAAERAAGIIGQADPKLETVEACQRFVDIVVQSKSWGALTKKHGGPGYSKVTVRPGFGARKAFASGSRITLPRWARSPGVILHELAHVLNHRSRAGHGWEFCAIYLDLVSYWMSKDDAARLKAAFQAGRVKFRAPKKRAPVSEERKAQLREQLAKGREKAAATRAAKKRMNTLVCEWCGADKPGHEEDCKRPRNMTPANAWIKRSEWEEDHSSS